MRNTIVTLFAAACMAAPLAHAEGTPITVDLTYDSTQLATETGARAVLQSIKSQAKEACSFTLPVSGRPTFDRVCRDDLVEKAIAQIRLAANADGQAVTYVFASVED